MARVMSSRAKPILSIWAMTGSLWEPLSSAEGSLRAGVSAEAWGAAGEGVAGAAGAGLAKGAGAGGAAGVEAGAPVGVDGA